MPALELPHSDFWSDMDFFKRNFILPEKYKNLFVEGWEKNYADRWYTQNFVYYGRILLPELKTFHDQINNFVYDRYTGTVFYNLSIGTHHRVMSCLYSLHKLCVRGETPVSTEDTLPHWYAKNSAYANQQDISYKYLEEGMGLYVSSVSHRIQKSRNMKLTSQEQIIFRNYEITNI